MPLVESVRIYVATKRSTPGTIAWWIRQQRESGEGFIIIEGRTPGAAVAAHLALQQSGTVIACDPDSATTPYHPLVKQTDRGANHRSDRVPFRLAVLLGPAEPLGTATGVMETDDGRGRIFIYGAPLPPASSPTATSRGITTGA
jgi:hypothetical protein